MDVKWLESIVIRFVIIVANLFFSLILCFVSFAPIKTIFFQMWIQFSVSLALSKFKCSLYCWFELRTNRVKETIVFNFFSCFSKGVSPNVLCMVALVGLFAFVFRSHIATHRNMCFVCALLCFRILFCTVYKNVINMIFGIGCCALPLEQAGCGNSLFGEVKILL